MLLDNLEKRDNYEVKGLMLAVEGAKVENPRVVVSKTVPEDAAVVVVAGPTNALQPATIEALKKYMREPHKEKDPLNPEKDRQRKGKLMVLADVVAEDNRMKPLNLDRLGASHRGRDQRGASSASPATHAIRGRSWSV